MLGDRLRALRTRKKLTQDEVAKSLGITRPAYTQYEQGVRKPDAEMLARLASIYEVSIDYIVTGSSDKDSDTVSTEQQEFLEWMEGLGDAFFYDFHKSPEEQKKQFIETMRALWEVEKKRGNIKGKE